MAKWNEAEAERLKNQNNAENNKWKNMLNMLQAANSTRPDTMLGYGLGKLLKRWVGTAYDDYMRSRENKRQPAKEEGTQSGQYNPTIAQGLLPTLPFSASVDPAYAEQNLPAIPDGLGINYIIPEDKSMEQVPFPQRGN